MLLPILQKYNKKDYLTVTLTTDKNKKRTHKKKLLKKH